MAKTPTGDHRGSGAVFLAWDVCELRVRLTLKAQVSPHYRDCMHVSGDNLCVMGLINYKCKKFKKRHANFKDTQVSPFDTPPLHGVFVFYLTQPSTCARAASPTSHVPRGRHRAAREEALDGLRRSRARHEQPDCLHPPRSQLNDEYTATGLESPTRRNRDCSSGDLLISE